MSKFNCIYLLGFRKLFLYHDTPFVIHFENILTLSTTEKFESKNIPCTVPSLQKLTLFRGKFVFFVCRIYRYTYFISPLCALTDCMQTKCSFLNIQIVKVNIKKFCFYMTNIFINCHMNMDSDQTIPVLYVILISCMDCPKLCLCCIEVFRM